MLVSSSPWLSEEIPADARVKIHVLPPVSGRVGKLSEHPDPLVQAGLLGQGAVLTTSSHQVLAPMSGKVVACDPLSYSFLLHTRQGLRLTIAYGFDTARLMGEKCEFKVRVGDQVKAGQVVLQINPVWLKRQQIPNCCTVTVRNTGKLRALVITSARQVTPQHDTLFTVYA
ncbi:PTS glucose transporter subunit IIA [Alteromonas sp. ASW11-19]|uniref:PTS system glucose-specific EIIA component n=1 Tax=Alteromonas salexigens TaxID=2982530 RepID=A0ABT2VKP3_9ALTE|nr:PTS glucose transporter subunit IIA [Alteromonas salexigens]MCU7553867.1 PTS glucose transporter subunit IIA [Alteromonas salexigens]